MGGASARPGGRRAGRGRALLTGPSSSGGKSTSTDLIRWAVAAFPSMAAAECTVLIVLAVRGLQSLRSRRRNHA
ncbi:hypothetical protein GCM10010289_80770 [Streptomyces violascens]|uniref:Uncharacterized protein n=1 Tax=Streptomyces violascens TaxID=67381 RepID=A0ABQ3QSA4_9ACTN|nr:hypothetical protein GCM10010289_80770 [Streptomyces violascens]GHI40142.1 hypothetical protein Sviol_45500 [Streptomyces violascens]